MKYDFSGRAATTDVRCTDGTMFRRGAFKHNDGKVVPLVWMHKHGDPGLVLGKALLRNGPDGLDVYGAFNNTQNGKDARELVAHGDVTSLSIWANNLQRKGNDFFNGDVKEVSLVLAPADPTARIEETAVVHSEFGADDTETEEAEIFFADTAFNTTPGEIGDAASIAHADEKKDETTDDKNNTTKEDKTMKVENEKGQGQSKEKTLGDVFNTLNEEQKTMVYALLAAQMEQMKGGDNKDDEEDVEHYYEGDPDDMKYNVFSDSNNAAGTDFISHDEMANLVADSVADGKRYGSFKDAFIEHAAKDYGIDDVDILFPDAKTITNSPDFISRESAWVGTVMSGTHHSPFARVKSVFANITADEARARGYMKGKKKLEEVITLLKRSTDPQTVYKKQKMDRDDIIDITDFDVITWLKSEMRIMLDEELAGAILVGDGRSAASDDKIHEDHIRPICSDDDLYAFKVKVADVTDDASAKAFIKSALLGYTNYKGSGNKTMFIKESALAHLLLIEDGIGHLLYATQDALATTLRVSKIVEVPDEIFERNETIKPIAIIVDLNDYNVGADKGGAVSMFDDFDIDYNQQKYLLETRCSGALVRPFSAMVLNTTTDSTLTAKSPIKVDVNGKPVKTTDAGSGSGVTG